MRRPEFSLYHAGGLDSLVGAVKWTPHGGEQDEYVASDLFYVRDHLGSVVMTLKAEKTCVMWSDPGPGEGDPVCLQSNYVLVPQESYDYAPYGTPTIHVPATAGLAARQDGA